MRLTVANVPFAIKWVLLYALYALSGILCLRIVQRERAGDGSRASFMVAANKKNPSS